MSKGKQLLFTHACVGIIRLYVTISYTSESVRTPIRVPRPALAESTFLLFDRSFLEAPRMVPFHATAIHCHHSMDLNDASFFVLGSELLVCPNSKLQSAREYQEMDE